MTDKEKRARRKRLDYQGLPVLVGQAPKLTSQAAALLRKLGGYIDRAEVKGEDNGLLSKKDAEFLRASGVSVLESEIDGDKDAHMTAPHIRIFPHSQTEFPSRDALTMWLLTSLKARGGRYLLPSKEAVAELPPGSLVLFRHGHVLVGEAVTVEYFRTISEDDWNLIGDADKYEACVRFSPSSIRIFAPPIAIEELQSFIGKSKDIVSSAQPRFIIENWDVYPRLLAHHIVNKSGTFIS